MDSLEIEKILAMKKYNNNNNNNNKGTQQQDQQTLNLFFLPKAPIFVNYALTAVTLMLFVTSPVWVPEIPGYLRVIFFAYLPDMMSFFTGPKFLFVVCNLIVVILVSESKLSRAPSARDMYEKRLIKNLSDKMSRPGVSETTLGGDEWKEAEEGEEEGEVDNSFGEGEEEGDPIELHNKVENFIARVKSQRRIEAKICLCY